MAKVKPKNTVEADITAHFNSKLWMALIGLLGLLFFQSAGAEALSVEPYANSSLSSSGPINDKDYLVLISAPKRVNNQLRIEKELRVDVEGVTETYRINDGHTTEQAFNHYFAQLKQLGGNVIYQCASRDCGSSSSWAEDVFRNSKLYGKDGSQFYLSSAIERDGQQWLVIVYTVERGNRRVYAHIQTLKLNTPVSEGTASGDFDNKSTIFVFSYELNGVIDLNPKMSDISKVIKLSEATPTSKIYIVGHLTEGYKTTTDAIESSKEAAELLGALLRKRGVGAEKLSIMGVGPLVPVSQGERSGNRVEVLVIDK